MNLHNINIEPDDKPYVKGVLNKVPYEFHKNILQIYDHKFIHQSRRDANLSLLDVQDYVTEKEFLNDEIEALKLKAKRLSKNARKAIQANHINAALGLLEDTGIPIPLSASDLSLQARLIDSDWWLRQLIKKHDRQFEASAIKFGLVRRDKQPYVSSTTVNKLLARKQRSLQIMDTLEAVADDGETIDMLDIVKGSMANPAVRRAELMNRLHGFEQYAKAHKHVAEFYTITCPSKYHPSSSKYNDWTPRQTQQQYLSPLWAKIRAKLKRDGLSVYGFRIAEPHADGCPHWHILMFMLEADKPQVRAVLHDYALAEDGSEKGAYKHRFTIEAINPDKGSAIAYIAKYISKNVDGFGMEDEIDKETGTAVNESAQRVLSWASVWGIRQFQQIGGSSVTVWRELRRLDKAQDHDLL